MKKFEQIVIHQVADSITHSVFAAVFFTLGLIIFGLMVTYITFPSQKKVIREKMVIKTFGLWLTLSALSVTAFVSMFMLPGEPEFNNNSIPELKNSGYTITQGVIVGNGTYGPVRTGNVGKFTITNEKNSYRCKVDKITQPTKEAPLEREIIFTCPELKQL